MYARSTTGAGFTIIEVMIFLAISGLMFVAAINALGGKQQNTEFSTGVDTLRAELSKDLSNVGDGNYDVPLGTNCTATTTGPPTFGAAPADGSCTLIGEIISFNHNPSPENYLVYPVIGRTYLASPPGTNQVAVDLTDAEPRINNSYRTSVAMPFGLTIYDGDPSATISSVGNGVAAFGLFSFTSFEGSVTGDVLYSGSEHVEIAAIPRSTLTNVPSLDSIVNGTPLPADNLADCGTGTNIKVCVDMGALPSDKADINPSGGVTFCVNSGTTSSNSALFTVGGSNSPTSVTDQIFSTSGCT